ncbi:MAG: lycopene cyclase domain-containing protein [Actinomycetes bacterium]
MTVPEYTILAALSVVAVVLLEVRWWRTGLFRDPAYWLAMAICFGFMIVVNGWLTKLTAPIVIYDGRFNLGVRFPWDIPVEDFLFGFSMLTLTMLLWDRAGTGSPTADR